MRVSRVALAIIMFAPFLAAPLALAASEKDPAGEIVQNNLFSPGRAPVKPPPPQERTKGVTTPQPPPESPPVFTLYGVIIVDKEPPQALLEEPRLTAGRSRLVNLGDQVGSYVVTAIEPERVLLQKDGSSLTVNLLDPGNPKKQARPIVAAPAAPASPVAPVAGPVQGARPEPPTPGNRDQMRTQRDQMRAERMQRMQQFREQLTQGQGAEGSGGGGAAGRPGRSGRGGSGGLSPGTGMTPGTGGIAGKESGSFADVLQRTIQPQTGSSGPGGTPGQ